LGTISKAEINNRLLILTISLEILPLELRIILEITEMDSNFKTIPSKCLEIMLDKIEAEILKSIFLAIQIDKTPSINNKTDRISIKIHTISSKITAKIHSTVITAIHTYK